MLLLEDKLNKIKNKLYIYDEFGCQSDEDFECGYAMDDLYRQLCRFIKNFSIHRGVSKVVIVNDFCSYVIKIPFNGEYITEYDEDFNIENEYFNKFKRNYCQIEVNNYKIAEAAGFGCFFARTVEYGTTNNGYPIYVQEKVIPTADIWNKLEDFDSELLNYISEHKYLMGFIYDLQWTASAITHYGIEKFCQFLNFAKQHKDIVNDMHEGNYGYRLNGEPVLLDFSGWYE